MSEDDFPKVVVEGEGFTRRLALQGYPRTESDLAAAEAELKALVSETVLRTYASDRVQAIDYLVHRIRQRGIADEFIALSSNLRDDVEGLATVTLEFYLGSDDTRRISVFGATTDDGTEISSTSGDFDIIEWSVAALSEQAHIEIASTVSGSFVLEVDIAELARHTKDEFAGLAR